MIARAIRIAVASSLAPGLLATSGCAANTDKQARPPAVSPSAEPHAARDFAFPPLRFYDFKIDRQEITRENAGELYRNVRLSDFRGKRPVVVLFGNENNFVDLAVFEPLHQRYDAWLQFLFVYTADPGETDGLPDALDQMRRANTFVRAHDLQIPCLVETPETRTDFYGRNGDRIFLVDRNGELAFAAPPALSIDELERVLQRAAVADVGL